MANLHDSFMNGPMISKPFAFGATSGNQAIVDAATGYNLEVFAVHLTAETAVNVQFKAGTTGATLSGPMYLGDKDQINSDNGCYPVFQPGVGMGFALNLSAAKLVGGWIVYRQYAVSPAP